MSSGFQLRTGHLNSGGTIQPVARYLEPLRTATSLQKYFESWASNHMTGVKRQWCARLRIIIVMLCEHKVRRALNLPSICKGAVSPKFHVLIIHTCTCRMLILHQFHQEGLQQKI